MDKKLQDDVINLLSKLNWELSVTDIEQEIDAILQNLDTQINSIIALPNEEKNFENTFAAIEKYSAEASDRSASIYFPAYTAEDENIRMASTQATKKLSQFFVKMSMNVELYQALKTVADRNLQLDTVDTRLIEKTMNDFKRNGLHLPKETRDQVEKLAQRLSDLSIQFSQNLNEVKDTVTFTADELIGVPETIINNYKRDDKGNYIVGMSYPEYIPVVEYAKSSKTRKKIATVFGNRAQAVNTPLLEEAIKLRHEKAQLLGYKSHAHYIISNNMAKSPDIVWNFLNDLTERLHPLGKDELKTLVKLKNEELDNESNGQILSYDYSYYTRIYKERYYQIDNEEIKQYFPTIQIIDNMLTIYQELLGLTFHELSNITTWHEDVRVFAITDKNKTDHLIGVFFLDLFPREGKFSHAAAFPLISGRLTENGYHSTVAALVTNFDKPKEDIPSLLKHSEVVTLFHEFGHIMHQTLTTARYSRFSGTSVATDFVEAPSQMLENWVWQQSILQRISSHYKTGEKLPTELIDKMIRAKNANIGLATLRQLFFGTFDMTLHSKYEDYNLQKLWSELSDKISLIPGIPETNPAAAFGHIMGGYSAGYYGYLWSKVYAQDLFTRFEETDVLDTTVGYEYRKTILEPGSEREEMELVKAFLHREPNNKAFIKSLGLN